MSSTNILTYLLIGTKIICSPGSSVEPDDDRGMYQIALAAVGGVLVLGIAVVGTVVIFKRCFVQFT